MNGQYLEADKDRKHAESQKRRLESLAEKRRLEQQRKELISASLRNSAGSKRIVFDSDDEFGPVSNANHLHMQTSSWEILSL